MGIALAVALFQSSASLTSELLFAHDLHRSAPGRLSRIQEVKTLRDDASHVPGRKALLVEDL